MITVPTYAEWQQFSEQKQEAFARSLAKHLPATMRFSAIETYSMGGVTNRVAQFVYEDNSVFMLLNAGEIELGFDVSSWEPGKVELESWHQSVEEYGFTPSMPEWVEDVTGSSRHVHIAPVLIEVVPSAVPIEYKFFDQAFKEQAANQRPIFNRHLVKSLLEKESDQVWIREGYDPRQPFMTATHAAISAEFAHDGFRFPTVDEWEFACGGGTRTLWRWGNHLPPRHAMAEMSPADRKRLFAWLKAPLESDCPTAWMQSGWNLDRQRNGFGLNIAQSTWKVELTAEPTQTRGGDGGGAECGGIGYFLSTLILATAYNAHHACTHEPNREINPSRTIGRRVFPLSD